MPGPSGLFTSQIAQARAGSPSSAIQVTPSRPLPIRQPVTAGNTLVDNLNSTPEQRAGSTSSTGANVSTIQPGTPVIGITPDDSASASRLSSLVAANNQSEGQNSQSSSSAALSGLLASKGGVLSCAAGGSGATDPAACLEALLSGNLLDADAKSLLCGMIQATERAAKRQVDATGNALLKAAQDLTNAQTLQAPLNTLASFLNGLDPGAVAACFGAAQLKAAINGRLKAVNTTIAQAQAGVQGKIADAFQKATSAADQFGKLPNLCSSGSPASLGSLL